jgi:hypothetical protein
LIACWTNSTDETFFDCSAVTSSAAERYSGSTLALGSFGIELLRARSFADAALTSAATLPTDAPIALLRDIAIVAHPFRDGSFAEDTQIWKPGLIGIAFNGRLLAQPLGGRER